MNDPSKCGFLHYGSAEAHGYTSDVLSMLYGCCALHAMLALEDGPAMLDTGDDWPDDSVRTNALRCLQALNG